MLVCIAPSGPIQPSAPGVRAAPDRLELLEDLHRADLRRAGDRPAREGGGQQVERVAPGREPAGDRRDEVLDRGGPLEAAEPRDADAPRAADAAEVVAQHVDDHHVLGAVLGAREQLAGQRPVLVAVAAARPRALDRVASLTRPSASTARNGSGEADSSARGRPVQLARAEVEVRREERRVARPQPPVAVPRVGLERRLEPPGQVGLVDVAAGDVRRGPASTPASYAARERPDRNSSVGPSARLVGRGARASATAGLVSRAWTSSSRRASRRASPSSARPPSHASPGPPVPGDDPVVQGEAQERQPLVVGRDRRQPLEGVPEVVAEEADQPAEEARRVGRDDDRPVEPGDEPARDRERVRPGGRAPRGRRPDRRSGSVQRALRPGRALSSRARPGQVAERLGHVDRASGGEAVREPPEPERGARSGRGDHGAMIRRADRRAAPASIGSRMRSRDLGIVIGRRRPGPGNAITDVAGVRVGHTTLISGDGPLVDRPAARSGRASRSSCRTTATRGRSRSSPAAHRLNGNGELTGLEWIREAGQLGGVVGLTNTHSVGVVHDALIAAAYRAVPDGAPSWSLPVVGETWDGALNDTNGFHVRPEHVDAAIGGGDVRAGRRGRRRRRHRDGLPRVQGRDRDERRGSPRPTRAAGRSARSCRPTTASGPGCASTGCGSARRSRRRTCRRRTTRPTRSPPAPAARGRRRGHAPARVGLDHRAARDRRARSCRTSASAWPSGPGSGWRGSAARAGTTRATSSSPGRPATAVCRGSRARTSATRSTSGWSPTGPSTRCSTPRSRRPRRRS